MDLNPNVTLENVEDLSNWNEK